MPSRRKASAPTRKPIARETLLRQTRELRRRLADSEARREEAEQTLDAIRTGAVDAVVVSGAAGEEQIYTLTGAERSYRLLVETVNAGAVTLALDGMVLYANRQASKLLGVPLERLIGARLAAWIAPEEHALFGELFCQASAGDAEADLHVLAGGISRVPVHVALCQLTLPDFQAVCVVMTDLTERTRAEDALRQAKAELEVRVAERTATLATMNDDLQEANIRLEELNAELTQEVDTRTHAEQAVLATEARYHALYESATDAIIITDPVGEGRVLAANPSACQLFGYTEAEFTRLDRNAILETNDPSVRTLLHTREADGRASAELPYRRKDGTRFIGELTTAFFADAQGQRRAVAIIRDVTARMAADEALRASLAEKDAALAMNATLLREVHHRVKNNLQMLCDLIYLQMEAMPHPEQHQDLQDAYTRIYAIARLHEQLYQSLASGQIRLSEYLTRLVKGFAGLYPHVSVTLEAAADGVALDVDRAIHVGLIVNELVTNAVKHAFAPGTPGVVTVGLLETGDQIQIEVRDNGRGLPTEVDVDRAKSVGLRTVTILARRLRAAVTITREGGTRFTLMFPAAPDPALEPRPDA